MLSHKNNTLSHSLTIKEEEHNDLLKAIQNHFTDGLTIIIGSGLSAAEGLPTMDELTQYLKENIKAESDINNWQSVCKKLDQGINLEASLQNIQISKELYSEIINLTSKLIFEKESIAYQEVLTGKRILRLTHLIEHLKIPNNGLNIITTNYDRLVELAFEINSIGVDTFFYGQNIAFFDVNISRNSFCEKITQEGKQLKRKFRKKVNLYKPHGSLDWYLRNNTPIKTQMPCELPRLIIPPGNNKYRDGYSHPFDKHRELGNKAIERATHFLIIGYGFNDEHLEVYLRQAIQEKKKPVIILSKSLSEKIQDMAQNNDNMITIQSEQDTREVDSSLIIYNKKKYLLQKNIWDLKNMITEVFRT